jgi:hypothetical protein
MGVARTLLGPVRRLLVLLARRDVAGDDEHGAAELTVVVADRVAAAEEPPCCAVGPAEPLLDLTALAVGGRADLLGQGRPLVDRRPVDQRLADEPRVPGE